MQKTSNSQNNFFSPQRRSVTIDWCAENQNMRRRVGWSRLLEGEGAAQQGWRWRGRAPCLEPCPVAINRSMAPSIGSLVLGERTGCTKHCAPTRYVLQGTKNSDKLLLFFSCYFFYFFSLSFSLILSLTPDLFWWPSLRTVCQILDSSETQLRFGPPGADLMQRLCFPCYFTIPLWLDFRPPVWDPSVACQRAEVASHPTMTRLQGIRPRPWHDRNTAAEATVNRRPRVGAHAVQQRKGRGQEE